MSSGDFSDATLGGNTVQKKTMNTFYADKKYCP